MSNTNVLKKSKSSKGTPPKRGESPAIIDKNPRKEEKNKPLQVMTPPQIFDEYAEIARKEFGNFKGAKSMLFVKMFEYYKNHE